MKLQNCTDVCTPLASGTCRRTPTFTRIATDTLRRFWTMLAHHQSGLLNVAQLARNIGVNAKTAQSYIDLLCALLLVRRLPPWHANVGKRLVKSPKVYVRDIGLVHALLDIDSKETLMSHMVLGASWEGFVIENLLQCAPASVQAYFYRSSGSAEVDLLLVWPANGPGIWPCGNHDNYLFCSGLRLFNKG